MVLFWILIAWVGFHIHPALGIIALLILISDVEANARAYRERSR